MESLVLTPLNSLESHLNALVTSLTQTNTFATAPQIAKDLVSDDDDLRASLNLLQRHQQNYAQILNLRAEVTSLQNQLKETIRRCVALRQEIGDINPTILNSSDSDEEEEQEHGGSSDTHISEVDYHTLLTFAARIGKHNAVAAREAEEESVRRKIAAAQAKSNDTTSTTAANGLVPGDLTAGTQDASSGPGDEGATAETAAELARINNNIAVTRAQMGMAFPDANVLRVGALGQLQLFLERQRQLGIGDEEALLAVDREAGRLVRETEDVADADDTDADRMEQATSATAEGHGAPGWPSPEMTRRSTMDIRDAHASSASAPKVPKPPKKKVDLDLPSSDEEDDDD